MLIFWKQLDNIYKKSFKKERKCKSLSHIQLFVGHIQLFVTPWAVACQTPSFIEFYRQEYWSG